MLKSSIFGILLGIIAIFGVYFWDGGNINSVILIPSIFLVIGGTLAAGITGFSLNFLFKIPVLLKIAFFNRKMDVERMIAQIVIFSAIARRDGVLALEGRLDQIENPLLKKLTQACIDDAEKNKISEIFDSEVGHITDRHNKNINLFVKLGGYSPTMGIIGTVLGLINTLASAGTDPADMIRHIASAFIATLWGIFMANIVWFPIADKLRNLHNDEIRIYKVMYDGIYGIAAGLTPSMIQSQLLSYFPMSEQANILFRQNDLIKEISGHNNQQQEKSE